MEMEVTIIIVEAKVKELKAFNSGWGPDNHSLKIQKFLFGMSLLVAKMCNTPVKSNEE